MIYIPANIILLSAIQLELTDSRTVHTLTTIQAWNNRASVRLKPRNYLSSYLKVSSKADELFQSAF